MEALVQQHIVSITLISLLWVLPWKAYAVWLAARAGHRIWFVILLVSNTIAILEIIYVFVVAKKRFSTIKSDIKSLFSR